MPSGPQQTFVPPFPIPPPFMGMPFMGPPIPPPPPPGVAITASSSPSSYGAQTEPSKEEMAYLPFFEKELRATESLDPTDILIVDFDRTLIASPTLSKELLTKEARSVIETQLEAENTWWQSSDVLQAAIELDRFNDAVLDLVRCAAEAPNTLLVITTARLVDSVKHIKKALASKGVAQIDHISCLTGNSRRNTESQVRGKGVMLELLLETYSSLERVVVVDGNAKNAQRYAKAASKFVGDGWLNAEAVYVVDAFLNYCVLPPSTEKRLVEQLLKRTWMPIETHVLEQETVRRLTTNSRKQLIACLVSALTNNEFENIDCELLKSSGTERNECWRPLEIQVSQQMCRIRLQLIEPQNAAGRADQQGKQALLSAGRLKLACADAVVPISTDIVVQTYTYTPRRLDVMVNKERRKVSERRRASDSQPASS